MQHKHAVVTDNFIYCLNDNRLQKASIIPLHHVAELWRIGQQIDITHFWIMSKTIRDLAYDFYTAMPAYDIFVPLMDRPAERPAMPRSARCWKNQASNTHQIIIGYPCDDPWNWDGQKPSDILYTIDYVESALQDHKAILQWSPQHVGEQLLSNYYQATARLKSYLLNSRQLADLPFKSADRDIIWKSSTAKLQPGNYLHIYDKNSAHPSAAASMRTGIGEPVHIQGHIEQPTAAGIYRVSFTSGRSIFDHSHLPPVLDREWCTLATLQLALKYGYQVKIHEAYVFAKTYNIFGEWSRDLWKSRLHIRSNTAASNTIARDNAEDTIKMIMNRTISNLRLNWYADMVGQARAAQLANLAKWAADGIFPAFIYFDAMAFESADPNAATAVPNILTRSGQLGGYKHVVSVQITPELTTGLTVAARAGNCLALVKKASSSHE